MKGRLLTVAAVFSVAVIALDGQTPAPVSRRLPAFENVATRAGIDFHLDAGNAAQWLLLESHSAGVVVIDYDNDGWPDLYFVNGSSIEQLEARQRGRGNRLYHNNHDGTFTDVTARAGVAGNGAWGMGGCVGDVDNNGYDDIFVTNFGQDILYLNNGDGTFRDVSPGAGIQGGERWHTGCAFGDYDGDGDLDLYVSNYVQFDVAESRRLPSLATAATASLGTDGKRVLIGPQGYKSAPHEFYENIGGGRFVDVSLKSGVAHGGDRGDAASRAGGNGLGVVMGDYDNDGDLDVFVANDKTGNFLFRNNGDKTFTEVGVAAGVAFDARDNALASAGVDMADYDNDGWLDVFVTTFSSESPELFHNNRDGTFTDVARRAAMTPGMLMGRGAQFVDFDLDGSLDLIVANGHVVPSLDLESFRRTLLVGYHQRMTLYQQSTNAVNSVFRDQSLRVGGPLNVGHVGRGLAVADFNNDGQMDVVVSNQDDAPSLLMNRGVPGNWVLVKLHGTTSNRSAIGARVTVRAAGRTQVREVKSGGSYLSQSDLRVHFGLEAAANIDELTVRWPSGRVQTDRDVKANRIIEITER